MKFEEFYNLIDNKVKKQIKDSLDGINVTFSIKGFNNFAIRLYTISSGNKKINKYFSIYIYYKTEKDKIDDSHKFSEYFAFSTKLKEKNFKDEKEVLKILYEKLFLNDIIQRSFIHYLFFAN